MNVYRVYRAHSIEGSDLVVARSFSEAEAVIKDVKAPQYEIKKIERLGAAIVANGEKK